MVHANIVIRMVANIGEATFQFISSELPVANVCKVPGHCSCCRHHGADEVRTPTASLTSFKIAIAGGSAALTGLQDVGIHPQAHGATGLAPLKASFLKNSVQAFLLGNLLDFLGS